MSSSRLLKCGISSLVFASDLVLRVLQRLIGRKPAGTCVVLYYHSVPPEQRTRFARQLDTILRFAKPVDVTATVAPDRGTKLVGITFDDGFENFVSQALPELKKRDMPATMFVISGALGRFFGPQRAPEKVMTEIQLRNLPSQLVSIGSHTVSHPFMPELNDSAARAELTESKLALEKILGREINAFSFPFGAHTDALVHLAAKAGYNRVFTTLPQFAFGLNQQDVSVGRVRVDPTDWDVEFRLKLAGAYRWLPKAITWKKRLKRSDVSKDVNSGIVSQRSSIHEWNEG